MWNKKIAAIKQVREFCMHRGYATRNDFATYDNSAQDRTYPPTMGLKDAKDLIDSLEQFTENAPKGDSELTQFERGLIVRALGTFNRDYGIDSMLAADFAAIIRKLT